MPLLPEESLLEPVKEENQGLAWFTWKTAVKTEVVMLVLHTHYCIDINKGVLSSPLWRCELFECFQLYDDAVAC